MKGLPLGLHETTSGFWKRSTGCDARITSYYHDIIIWPVIFKKRSIVTKVGRIATKIGREKSVCSPKAEKTLQNFAQVLTARVCFPFPLMATLSDDDASSTGDVHYLQQTSSCCEALVLLGVRNTQAYVLLGLISGKTMRQSRHTYLTNHTNRHSCIRSLKRKGFKEEIVIKIGLYDLLTSATLESSKSLLALSGHWDRSTFLR
jgi:hypothetical protein